MDFVLTITNTKMKTIVLFITDYFTEMFTTVTFFKLVKFPKVWHKKTFVSKLTGRIYLLKTKAQMYTRKP